MSHFSGTHIQSNTNDPHRRFTCAVTALSGVDDISVEHPVDCYRMLYTSGSGKSPGRHPYYIADSIGPAVADMIAASQRVQGVPSTPVFLAGFSEGGWASLAALRVLESKGQHVIGSAQVAGAYDLRRDAFDRDAAHWYLDSFAANSLVDVTPRAPVRLYYGSKDQDVVPEEALAASRSMRARHGDVEAIDVDAVGTTPRYWPRRRRY